MEQPEGAVAAATVDTAAQPGGNLAIAVVAGLAAAIVGAALWAVVTVLTQMELGLMAIAVGFLVGWAIQTLARGTTPPFGIVGAVCALIGCVLGNLLSAVGFYANARGVPYFDVLTSADATFLMRLMTITFSPMDLLFYAIGIYEGYRFSIGARRVR